MPEEPGLDWEMPEGSGVAAGWEQWESSPTALAGGSSELHSLSSGHSQSLREVLPLLTAQKGLWAPLMPRF